MADADRCVCCGSIIPEGRQVCIACALPAMKNVSEQEASRIINGRCPKGRFWTFGRNGKYVGIDNSTGDAWTEEFDTLDKCVRWLKGEYEVCS